MRHSLLRISSSERLDKSTLSNDFRVSMPNDSYMGKIQSFAVKEVTIPNTSYNITSKNNILQFTYEGDYQIIIPPGNYSLTKLLSVINPLVGIMFFEQDALTQKLRVYKLSSLGYSITECANSIASTLGFLNLPLLVPAAPGRLADALPDLSGIRNFYISSNTLGDGNCMISPTLPKLSIIAVVPNTVPFGSICYYQSNEQLLDTIEFSSIFGKNCSYIDLQLRDIKGGLIDLNGEDWSILIKVYY